MRHHIWYLLLAVGLGCSDAALAPPVLPTSLVLSAESLVLAEGATAQLSATLQFDDSTIVDSLAQTVIWVSTDTSVVTIAGGVVTARGPGSATVGALAEGHTAQIPVRVGLVLTSLAVPAWEPCGVSTTARAWCWGFDTIPAAINTPVRFRLVTSSTAARCGLSLDSLAWCWGSDGPALGRGAAPVSHVPVAVAGGHKFRTLSAGGVIENGTMCGIASDGTAWCWGSNDWGKLGDGTLVASSSIPVAVQAGASFAGVTPGIGFTCAVTTSGGLWCWGANNFGQMATGTPDTIRHQPASISLPGSPQMQQVALNSTSACALDSGGRAWCWGWNGHSGLGRANPVCTEEGVETCIAPPDTVSGGHRFTMLSSNDEMTCGITVAGALWCWGWDRWVGRIGTGALITQTDVPVRALAPHTFTTVSVGEHWVCGLTTADQAYCSGYGTSQRPRKVLRQL